MDTRIVGFILAATLIASRVIPGLRRAADRSDRPERNQRWNLVTLVLASAVTLFAELALIRWVATEVRIFAYIKSLALLLCFLGFGLGCALANRALRWAAATSSLLGLILIVRLPWRSGQVMESLSQSLGAAHDIQIWGAARSPDRIGFLLAAALTAILLWLITSIFIPLGQTVSRQIELAPRPLYGYSWNLAGSLAGILLFFAVSWLALPPAVWFLGVLIGMAFIALQRSEKLLLIAAMLPVALLLHDPSSPQHFNLWTPYQQIEVEKVTLPDGELAGTNIRVNHTGYQYVVNLSSDFLQRHPGLMKEPPDENPYNFPFRFTTNNPRVLIVGSGSGNDVAGALRNGSRSVDAVEIDPAILRLGRSHPEHPYDDPRVNIHLTDARAFMKRATAKYDLILFGLLDSHTQLSDYSNMRIDNFVYTQESFREARALLAPDGVLFVKFQVNQPWLGRRIAEMLTETFGKAPTVFLTPSSYSVPATSFAISASGQVEGKLTADPRLSNFVTSHRLDFGEVQRTVTTDDWPYLYHEGHWIPGIFFLVSLLVILVAAASYFQIPEARTRVPSLFFFSMGAGFLLLETQVVSRLALYFGTTWQVNGIVISAILSALLLANYVIEKQRAPWPRVWTVAGLLAGIAFAYLVPFGRIPGSATWVGTIAAAVFSIPIFFAGMLFASEFRTTESPSAALAANMLGAVVGGLLENLSLITGLKALLLVAAGLYVVAAIGFPRTSSTRAT
jgi:spermidine synthase